MKPERSLRLIRSWLAAIAAFVPVAAAAQTWTYTLEQLKPGQLSVAIDFGQQAPGAISVLEKVRPVLQNLVVQTDAGRQQIHRLTGMIKVERCSKGCRVQYQVSLPSAARALGDPSRLAWRGELAVGSPSSWLLHPLEADAEQAVEWKIGPQLRPAFATGLLPGASAGTWISRADKLHDLPLTLIGKFSRDPVELPGGMVDLVYAPGPLPLPKAVLSQWVRASAEAVAGYFGRFPVPHVLVYLVPEARGGGIGGGVTMGDGGAAIVVSVGQDLSSADLKADWVMTHEMVHLALPAVPARHHWLEEGLATYVEPVARLRHGDLQAGGVFADMMAGLPQGLPKDGDQGLDRTPTWGRTYWGGALFWFLADVELRQQTAGRLGIEDALKGLLKTGASHAHTWEIADVLAAADKDTGRHVLSELYRMHGEHAVHDDLAALWQRLGVHKQKDQPVQFDEQAPLAAVRRAIVTGKAP